MFLAKKGGYRGELGGVFGSNVPLSLLIVQYSTLMLQQKRKALNFPLLLIIVVFWTQVRSLACHVSPWVTALWVCTLKLLSYESSTLILYKELSNTIYLSKSVSQKGIRDFCPDLHFVHYIKAQMPSIDPVSSITNCHCLIVSYTDPVHSFIIS